MELSTEALPVPTLQGLNRHIVIGDGTISRRAEPYVLRVSLREVSCADDACVIDDHRIPFWFASEGEDTEEVSCAVLRRTFSPANPLMSTRRRVSNVLQYLDETSGVAVLPPLLIVALGPGLEHVLADVSALISKEGHVVQSEASQGCSFDSSVAGDRQLFELHKIVSHLELVRFDLFGQGIAIVHPASMLFRIFRTVHQLLVSRTKATRMMFISAPIEVALALSPPPLSQSEIDFCFRCSFEALPPSQNSELDADQHVAHILLLEERVSMVALAISQIEHHCNRFACPH